MIYVKIIIYICLFFSIYKIVQHYGQNKKRQLKNLNELKDFFVNVKNEVENFNTPLLTIIENNSIHLKNCYSDFFIEVLEKIKSNNESPVKIYEEVFKKHSKNFDLIEEHKKILLSFKKFFEIKDKNSFLSNIKFVIDKIDVEINFLNNKAKEDEILYNKLSILAGLVVVIVFM